ncbi:hypothetical protein GIB67_019082 [Kingdonia uniflora]|uniref:Uncharacterized protein n=1 Tax=Kingdonia uniflora TaxID=39325 RepID=A0A7J7MZI8_9MAGN|nr:hypothetical protein GIB67_019082 [Kingdonia uniflora]
MAKQTQILFLEEWLRNNSNASTTTTTTSNTIRSSPPSSARAIIQAWSELRDSLQTQSFKPHHLQSLQTLLNSQSSLHVADPQAKLLLNILSSPNLSPLPPPQSHPLFFRLLYIWLRKSSKPSVSLVESSVPIVSGVLNSDEGSLVVVPNGVLLLGALCSVPVLSESSKRACLELMCRVLEERCGAVASRREHFPEVLAGIGYALSSCGVAYFSRILNNFFGIWNAKVGGVRASITHGLLILHLIEWVVSSFIISRSFEKIKGFCQVISRIRESNYVPFALVMAAAGALRALNRSVGSVGRLEIGPQLRNSLEKCIDFVADDLIAKTRGFCYANDDPDNRIILQCLSLGLTRCGQVAYRATLLLCLVYAMLFEIFPLQTFYSRLAEYPNQVSTRGFNEVEEHLDSILFKEGGAVTRVFCNQYVSAEEDNKGVVENLLWGYCQDIYSGHCRLSLLLHDRDKKLLEDLEKIAEACFLMVVVFASVVTKNKLSSKLFKEMQFEVSVKILVSFSCVEYFRRVRLPEYTDTIRGVVVSVQDNESSCVSFIESMPSYAELTNYTGLSSEKREDIWSQDGVQTARILFYLRIIPTCIERVPVLIFREVVAPTMFLFMGHPNGKVSRASHSVFVAFISSGKDLNQDDRVLLKEQLVFFYMKRALEAYPEITPFEGMASGVTALVRHLPAGSPAIFYCINSCVERANSLCSKAMEQDAEIWKNWEGDSEHCKKLLELLLRLMYLVDIQVLPNLMKLLAQLIVELPKDGQNMVLDEIYSLVAESDDVSRKPALVSWVQSLSFLCSQTIIRDLTTTEEQKSIGIDESLSLNRTSSRL